MSTTEELPTNFPHLQNIIKRDKASYQPEFEQQYRKYEALLSVFLVQPDEKDKNLIDLINFLAATCNCYPEYVEKFSQKLHDILEKYASTINNDVRTVMYKALMLLRNKGLIKPLSLYQLFFKLFRCKSKVMRSDLYTFIIQDIKHINSGHKDNKLNKSLQNFMYTMMKDSNATAVDMSLRVMVDLYKKRVWNDAKTVDVIHNGWFSSYPKVKSTALNFFLGEDNADENDSDDEQEDGPTARDIIMRYAANKKSAKAKQKREKALKALRRNKRKKNKKPAADFSAIQLLRDPDGDAERLLAQLKKSHDSFEVRLLMIIVLSRVIGVHQLLLLNFYSFLQSFLQPHQREVTKILLAVAQSSHDQVPPEELRPIIMKIANNFITEISSSDVMAIGLNSVREICSRCPLAMTEDLLHDLTQYKTKQDKTVVAAARSLVQLYRRINPSMLMRKDRGKPTEASREIAVTNYGEQIVQDFLPGSEALPSTSSINEDDELVNDDGWEEASDSCDDSYGSWQDVSSEEGEDADEEIVEETVEEKEAKIAQAQLNSQTRIFSQREFEEMRAHQAAKEITPAYSKKKKTFKRSAAKMHNPTENTELVALNKIETVVKSGNPTRESKMALVLAGREDREAFGRKRQKIDPFASTTNKQKRKNKNFMMMREKAKKKTSGRSFVEKQKALRESLLKRVKSYKH